MRPAYEYAAAVDRWVDADTVDLLIDLGFDVWRKVRVRLAGVDAPEIRGPERPQGLKALEAVRAACPDGSPVMLYSQKGGARGSFRRWIGSVWYEDRGAWRSIAAIVRDFEK